MPSNPFDSEVSRRDKPRAPSENEGTTLPTRALISMGGQVGSNPHPLNNFVPTTVTNNVFRGNIGFSIVINRWVDGLMVGRPSSYSVPPPEN
ncbi:uncharacterized protein THITE_2112661 [Thermothielavioides terrestris NRRL 8126]|uniref:Uncharacterized protein n=1 Tax=Thermothielavioides terrestris (strain ATCC 38088 / NRRL 8126) TaxID=578455 RepID=G2QZZ1_THETT|nr:uncharacterized protein THITE_2112661 [Thermothielavioides terrestris NRRL 8126]AEO65562.1 hypothetical protein THITE_2112661 [Thermothielavioides terrestris NRRL 8126]